jgi:uncharacterized protein (TIGR04551 family)
MARPFLLGFVVLAVAGSAWAQEPPAPSPAEGPATETPAAGAEEPGLNELLEEKAAGVAEAWEGPGQQTKPDYPWMEHHGYLRVRADGYFMGHLGTDYVKTTEGRTIHTSGFYPPLTDNASNASSVNKSQVGPQSENWIAGANMRFRYEPTIHVSETLRIHAQFDVLDNLLLGSTPDYNPSRPDAPLTLFSHTQAPMQGGRNSLRDAISVKQAYLTWDILAGSEPGSHLLSLSAGRMSRHWGLGIVESGGTDLDSDFGTYVDRITLLGGFNLSDSFGRLYFEVGYGWVATGPTSMGVAQPYGEPHNLSDTDDVTEVTFAVFKKPLSAAEREERFTQKVVKNKPVLDFGAYLVWRRQDLDISYASAQAYQAGTIDPSVPNGGYDQLALVPRNAWMLTPDVWLRLEWVPAQHKRLRIELEGAAVFGHVDRVHPEYPNSGMDFLSFGAALETEFSMKLPTGILSFGVDAGIATGDDSDYFGWLDHTNFADPSMQQASMPTNYNPRLSSFYFNPDYRPDQLLFRNMIGTVTDAFYVKPWVQYDLFEDDKDALGARLHVEYARALEARPTPGDDANLGLETNLGIFYQESDLFFIGVDWSMLWPFGAFDLIPTFENSGVSKSAQWCTALRGRVGIMF